MGREATGGILVAIVLGAAGLFLLAGALGESATTQVSPASIEPPTPGGPGIVYGAHETGGMNLFGLDLQGRDRWLEVGFVAPDACLVPSDDGDDEIAVAGNSEGCSNLSASGRVIGGGVTRDGVRWVTVRVDVSKACYESIEFGSEWPSSIAECKS